MFLTARTAYLIAITVIRLLVPRLAVAEVN